MSFLKSTKGGPFGLAGRGEFKGGGGGRGGIGRPLSGIRPPADPKGHLFGTFQEIHFVDGP